MGLALLAFLISFALDGSAPRERQIGAGSLSIATPSGPYVGEGSIPIQVTGTRGRVSLSALGPGSVHGNVYVSPAVSEPFDALIVAAVPNAYAIATLHFVPPPGAGRPLIAVAAYDSGIALHDPATFKLIGIVPVEGPPGDVAMAGDGTVYAPDTDGTSLFRIDRSPWRLSTVGGVALGNEVAIDRTSGAIFVSNRDVDGAGAVTRVLNGNVTRVVTGLTAEGLALDASRRLLYVGNINSDDVAEVQIDTMRIVRRIRTLPRPFGLALDEAHRRLAVVSNENAEMPQRGGYVATYRLDGDRPTLVARSPRLSFPVGIAFDAHRRRFFVTDEDDGVVYVLDAATLQPVRAPLRACGVPWLPHVDEGAQRLFIPCARADAIAVFDLQTLHPLAHSPFQTGRYPLGIASGG